MRQFFISFLITSLIVPATLSAATTQAPTVVSSEYLKAKYMLAKINPFIGQKIRVLIVPGHDDDVHGTAFGDLEEVDFNRVLAQALYDDFKKDPLFEPILTQTQGGYTDTFKTYLGSESSNIGKFITTARRAMNKLMRQGKVEPIEGSVQHNVAPDLVVGRLYGINKWSQENNVDLIIHIHFNDYPGRPWGKVGKYSGFTVYVPDEQLQNGKATQTIAPYVLSRLSMYMPISDLGGEKGGITKDLELIALGSNNTLIAPSMLIEYSYMYEPHLADLSLREKFLKEYAWFTYSGIKNYFESGIENPNISYSTFLPHTFTADLKKGVKDSAEVVALQTALRKENVYPGIGKTLTDCPINGSFGPCTELAVKAFQKKYGISQLGNVGPATRAKLNTLYSK